MSQIGIVFGKKHAPWTRIDNSGAIIDPDASFFSNHPTFAGIADEDIDGQSMVRVPAFYYRSDIVRDGPLLGKKALWVSDEPAEGYALHPAFRNHGADLAQFWLGKYQGTPDGDDKLGSQAGLMPLTRIDFPTMQARAAARGEGWMLWGIYQLAAIQALALIECGTPNVKSILGEGYTDGNGVRKVDDADVVQAAYRGITGLWGNVWQMLDGLQTGANREFLIWDKDGHRNLLNTGIEAPEHGWIHKRLRNVGEGFDLGAVFVPKKTRDEFEDAAYGNYSWFWANAVAYHGGTWAHGAGAGLFCLTVSSPASHVYTTVGGRLAKV